MINNFLPLLIRKPDQTKQNFRDPFFKELLKDSGGPLLHPPQWGESNNLKNPRCLPFTQRNWFVNGL